MPGKIASTASLTDDQIELAQVGGLGLFGIRPYWKDGTIPGSTASAFYVRSSPARTAPRA